MVAMTTYTVTAERSGKWWVLQADDVPGAITQVARLDQADQIKEAIAWVADVPESEVEIEVAVTLPEGVQVHLDRAAELREEARRANAESAEESREVARTLHEDLGLTVRDIGAVLEVSHQRAHQLVQEARPKVTESNAGELKTKRATAGTVVRPKVIRKRATRSK